MLPFANFSRNVRSFRTFSEAIFAKHITHEHPGGGFLAQVLEALAEVDEQDVVVPQQQIKLAKRPHTVKKKEKFRLTGLSLIFLARFRQPQFKSPESEEQ